MPTRTSQLSHPCLLTGATGFLGHYLLRELLARGRRCCVLLRLPVTHSLNRLRAQLAEIGVDLDAALGAGSVIPVGADLSGRGEIAAAMRAEGVREIVHCAASTGFDRDSSGEPYRTNEHGTRELLAAATIAGVESFHLVSTAFVCGRNGSPSGEDIAPRPADFHNDYERSKWLAETACARWAADGRGSLTVQRPSIIVGEFESGRTNKFDGFYIPVRAAEVYARRRARQSSPLRVHGSASGTQNIVPVDWVSKMIAGIVATPALHGRVYNLVHHDAPTARMIKSVIERHFGIRGDFYDAAQLAAAALTSDERAFGQLIAPVERYMVDCPRFARNNTEAAEAHLALHCERFDDAAILRLIRYAQHSNWGRQATGSSGESSAVACYFERFLPHHVGQSKVARAAAMDAAVHFAIGDDPRDNWICRFDRGDLTQVDRVVRQAHDARCDFGYRVSPRVFWQAVSGKSHPQELLFTGEAEIFGDTERALKLAMILSAFSQEFPCDPQTLVAAPQLRRSA